MRFKLAIIGIVFLIVLFFVVFISSLFTKRTITSQQEVPIPTAYPTSSVSSSGKREALFLGTQPTQNINQQYFPVQQVAFTFSYPVSPADVVITTVPTSTATIFSSPENPSTIIVSPNPSWQPGITTITLTMKQAFQSPYFFKGSISYQLHTDFPKNPPPGTDY